MTGGHAGEEAVADAAHDAAHRTAEAIASDVTERPRLDPETLKRIIARVKERQTKVGYEGDYAAWIEKVTPPDMV